MRAKRVDIHTRLCLLNNIHEKSYSVSQKNREMLRCMYGCMDVCMDVRGHLSSVLPLLFLIAILIFIISWVRRVSWIWIQVSLIPHPENIGCQKTWVFIRKNLLKKLFFLLVIFWFPIVKIGFSMVKLGRINYF